MSNEIYQLLSEQFPQEMERTLNKGGASLTYIPVSEVVNRMNKVIGVGKWSLKVQSFVEIGDSIVAHVTVIASIDGNEVTRDGVGGQKIKRVKATGVAVDYGDEVKGAVSDAFKKAVQTFGIGLYLARSEDAIEIEQVMDAEVLRPVEPVDAEKLEMWNTFMSVTKKMTTEQKATLRKEWETYSNNAPVPSNAASLSNEQMVFLLETVVKIEFNAQLQSGAQ
jgi:recombination DNA repair RAD52 pathway protein